MLGTAMYSEVLYRSINEFEGWWSSSKPSKRSAKVVPLVLLLVFLLNFEAARQDQLQVLACLLLRRCKHNFSAGVQGSWDSAKF